MNADQINAKIYAGRKNVAIRLGKTYGVYRPNNAANPLTNRRGFIKVALNNGDDTYRKPNMPNNPYWHADMDGSKVCVGDYLCGNGSTYFVAGLQPLLPIVVVDCNRSIRISAAAQLSAGVVGAVGYSGLCDSPADSVNKAGVNPAGNSGVFVGWPCSILLGGKSQVSMGLPGSVKNSGWRILLPLSLPLVLRAGDIVIDDLGRRYAIEGAELGDMGWRINAQEQHT